MCHSFKLKLTLFVSCHNHISILCQSIHLFLLQGLFCSVILWCIFTFWRVYIEIDLPTIWGRNQRAVLYNSWCLGYWALITANSNFSLLKRINIVVPISATIRLKLHQLWILNQQFFLWWRRASLNLFRLHIYVSSLDLFILVYYFEATLYTLITLLVLKGQFAESFTCIQETGFFFYHSGIVQHFPFVEKIYWENFLIKRGWILIGHHRATLDFLNLIILLIFVLKSITVIN